MRKLLTYLLKILKLLKKNWAILTPIIISLFALLYSHKASSLSTRLAHLHIEPEIKTSFNLNKDGHNPILAIVNVGNIPVVSVSVNYQVFILNKETRNIESASCGKGIYDPRIFYSEHLKPNEHPELQLLGYEAPNRLIAYEFNLKYFRESDMREYSRKVYYFIDNNIVLNRNQFKKSPLYRDVMSNITSFSFGAEPNQVTKQPPLQHQESVKVFLPNAIPGFSFNIIKSGNTVIIPKSGDTIRSEIPKGKDNKQLQINLALDNARKAIKEENYERAAKKFNEAVELGDERPEVYNNWGIALAQCGKIKEGENSDKLFNEACEKCKKAIEIKSDFYEAYKNWSLALLTWSYNKKDAERNRMINDAILILKKLEEIKRGEGAYYLAYIYGLNDENECQEWLKIGEEEKTLPERQEAMVNPAFEKVRDKQWFKNIHWKGE